MRSGRPTRKKSHARLIGGEGFLKVKRGARFRPITGRKYLRFGPGNNTENAPPRSHATGVVTVKNHHLRLTIFLSRNQAQELRRKD